MSIPADIQQAIREINDNLNELLSLQTQLSNEATTTFDNINGAIAKLDPILDNAQEISDRFKNIEHLLYVILIVVLIIICAMFVTWFLIHVVPILDGSHTHPHTFKQVIRDFGTSPIRVAPDVGKEI